jgi:hypothetical protein
MDVRYLRNDYGDDDFFDRRQRDNIKTGRGAWTKALKGQQLTAYAMKHSDPNDKVLLKLAQRMDEEYDECCVHNPWDYLWTCNICSSVIVKANRYEDAEYRLTMHGLWHLKQANLTPIL